MDFSKATNEQLWVILRADKNCPNPFVVGAASELIQRKEMEAFIMKVVKDKFDSLRKAKVFLQMDRDDILSIGYIGVTEALNRFEPGRASFTTLLYQAISSVFGIQIQKLNTQKRSGERDVVSYHADKFENKTYEYYMVDERQDVEKVVMRKLLLEELTQGMNHKQKESLLLFLKGYTYKEIAEECGITSTGVGVRIKGGIQKSTGKKVNMSEIGLAERKSQKYMMEGIA